MFPRKLILYFQFWNIYSIIPQESLSVFTKRLLLENHLIQALLFIPRQILLPVSWKSRSGFRKTKYQSKSTPRSPRGYNHILHVKLGKLFYFCLSILCNNSDRIYKKNMFLNRILITVYMQPEKKKKEISISLIFIYFTLFYLIYIWNLILFLSLSIYFPT